MHIQTCWNNHKNINTVVVHLVPRYLLEDVGRGNIDPFLLSDYTHGKKNIFIVQILFIANLILILIS